jgi:hypothetical protein
LVNKILKYATWAFIQQLFVIIVFTSLLKVLPLSLSIIISVFIFSLLHYPNLFLMFTICLFETIILYFYVNIFSIIWIIFFHSVVAIVIKDNVPENITHGMRVLWSYYKK